MSKTISINVHKNAKPYSSLIEILNHLMDENNLNIAQLSKNTGLAFTTVKRLCSDPKCNPTLGSIEKIAEFFGVRTTELLGLEPLNGKAKGYRPNFSAWSDVPLISLRHLLKWPNNKNEITSSEASQFVKTDLEISEKTFALKAADETLEPKFSSGTILIFDPEKECKNKDYVVLHSKGKELPQIRQLLIDGSDKYTKIINPEFSNAHPTKLEKNTFSVLGVLVQAKINYF